MDRYELVEGASAKFWQVEVRGTDLIVEYGRIGTKGQASAKSFESEAAANAAAAKLVREKTGKGYIAVGSEGASGEQAAQSPVAIDKPAKDAKATEPKSAKEPKAAKPAPAHTAAEHGSLSWITDADLAAIAEKLAKKSKRAPDEIVSAAVGEGTVKHERPGSTDVNKHAATLAVLFDRDLLPARILGDVAFLLAYGSDWMSEDKLVSLAHLPSFPVRAYDYLLLKIGTRAPARLAQQQDATFPPAVSRLLPFMRRRLGMSSEPVHEDIASEFAASFLADGGDFKPWTVEGQAVVQLTLNTYDAVKTWVGTIGLGDVWDAMIARIAASSGFRDPWRALVFLQNAPIETFGSLLASCTGANDTLLYEILEARSDSADALVAIALGMNPGAPTSGHSDAYRLRETVAVVAGARLAAEGRVIPAALDECIWFLDTNSPEARNHAHAKALKAFPRDRILGRVRMCLDASALEGSPLALPARAPVGLGAHFDEALFERYLSELKWEEVRAGAAYAGRLGIECLPRFIERYETSKDSAKTAFGTAIQAILLA